MKDMTIDQLKERREAIVAELDNPEADLNALHDEMRAINAELEARKEAEAKKAEIRAAVAEGVGETIESIPEERKETMSNEEIRNSKEYIDAYAEYIKSGDPSECRALLTTNATDGTVPVPEYVYDIVKTAWDREGIMSRVRKSYIKGNLKIGYEVSSTPAGWHDEGEAVSEEELVLGVVNLVPNSYKKWISISDEAMDLRGTAFLDYIYDEIAYRIAKAAANALVDDMVYAGGTQQTTYPVQPHITAAPAMGTVANAIANLSDEAANPVIIMNKLTWSAFKEIQYANGYGADPFEGLTVLFNDTLPAYSGAEDSDVYMIVGDLDQGALANFPNGNEITFKYDDLTLAHQDLVRIIGREFVALGIVAPKAFCLVEKPE